MKQVVSLGFAAATLALAATAPALAATVTVESTGSLYVGAGGSTLATTILLGPGTSALTFSALGSVTYNGSSFNDPDGIGSVSGLGVNAAGGVSGYRSDHAGQLAGYFGSATPPTTSATPATLDFRATGLGTSFTTLTPTLNQAFFIGDGLTGDGVGSVQTFFVPTGATTLFLGFADAPGYYGNPGSYGDNLGELRVTVNAVTSGVPEPSTWAMMLVGFAGLAAFGARRRSAAA